MEKYTEDTINHTIDYIKSIPIVQKAHLFLNAAMDKINDRLTYPPVSLTDLVKKFSPETDRLIIDIQKKEGLAFVAGRLTAKYQGSSSTAFVMELRLYFKNDNGKFILAETNENLPLKLLSIDSASELEKKEEISYEVDGPM